ncbi:zinc ribbon domain-containing protein [Flavobacterium sp. W22_SRS_FP1]|uniref:zinc ribbon domain-containing protein n=1 Tax=Flavobacterium sp. W22_SRS_FP1 TaxID=3240276 RepID=UPI003F8EE6D7
MEIKILCQSCGIPLDTEALKSTEKNGLKNEEYCKFCYDKGEFTSPNLSLDELKETIEIQMKKLKLPDDAIQDALNILPNLNRWKVN